MTDQELKRTPLHEFHLDAGARMTAFAGYDMPLQYTSGIMKEHQQVRENAGLFDVSHMGQLTLTARSGDLTEAAAALETLVPVDVLGLRSGRQRYAFFTDETGGILDDLMISHLGDRLTLVVNAACKEADEAHLKQHLPESCLLERVEQRALLALQGPKAGEVFAKLAPESAKMKFMDARELDVMGIACTVTRSGYTGEDGFEISIPNEHAKTVAEALCEDPSVAPIGLGARDSLRLEAGLCLYGSDIDQTTSPVEASLTWAIQKTRRTGGDRAGNFPGAVRILKELQQGPARKRVGLKPDGRAPVRAGADLYRTEDTETAIGQVTSGVFGPSVGGPVAMGYVPAELAKAGNRLFAEVRGKRLPVDITDLPFVTPGARPR